MINFSPNEKIYTCPYCNLQQAFGNSFALTHTQFYKSDVHADDAEYAKRYSIYTLRCTNTHCHQYTVIAINNESRQQVDIAPQHVFLRFPDYIPVPIRADYEEASQILDLSPKAAATLLRRCLQGMIRDFWGITKGRLFDEVTDLKSHIPAKQWKAIDGLRQLGNIGAHMEKDVNLIIDIEKDEAQQLLRLVEMLMGQWYINRHNQEALYDEISQAAAAKAAKKNP